MPAGSLAVLNIAIIIFAILFLLSAISSHLLESISGFTNSRGRHLRKRMDDVLGAKVLDEIYGHPIIKSLASDGEGRADRFRPTWPAYIEGDLFARVTAELFLEPGTATSGHPLFHDLLQESARDGTTFESKIAEWFKAVNDRLLGTYVRYTTAQLLLIGLIFGISLDIDIVHIGAGLWANPEVTSRLVSQLQGLKESGAAIDQSYINDVASKLQRSALQLYGWQGVPATPKDWAAKIIGWLLTAFGVSLGAQFWFRLLNEGLKLRAAGRKPGIDVDEEESVETPFAPQARTDAGASVSPRSVLPPNAGGDLVLANPTPALGNADVLGTLSVKYEVGSRGPGTVSTGKGDKGGVSYGSYQMTSANGGTVSRFIREGDYKGLEPLKPLQPGSPEFSEAWKKLARDDPSGFFEAQHQFIERTHYQPLVDAIRKHSGLDVEERSNALRNVIWSTAVQHGGSTSLVNDVLDKLSPSSDWRTDPDFDAKLIKAIYAERGRKNSSGQLIHFSKCSQSVQNSVSQRFLHEQQDALNMLANEHMSVLATAA